MNSKFAYNIFHFSVPNHCIHIPNYYFSPITFKTFYRPLFILSLINIILELTYLSYFTQFHRQSLNNSATFYIPLPHHRTPDSDPLISTKFISLTHSSQPGLIHLILPTPFPPTHTQFLPSFHFQKPSHSIIPILTIYSRLQYVRGMGQQVTGVRSHYRSIHY